MRRGDVDSRGREGDSRRRAVVSLKAGAVMGTGAGGGGGGGDGGAVFISEHPSVSRLVTVGGDGRWW